MTINNLAKLTPFGEKTELLVPAGSIEKLKIAVHYGADSIYIGTPDLSLRTQSEFTLEELTEAIEYAHSYGKRVYLTLNLFSHNKDIEKLPTFIDTIKQAKPDGVIIADPGVFSFVKQHAPDLDLHISTQANICSSLTVDFWKEQGAELCVLAREVSFAELKEIREKCQNIKLEVFVHGAMCMTYSGRCLLSNFMSERGANQGNCAHSCRWNYKLKMRLKDGTIQELEINDQNKDMFEFLLEEEIRPGQFMPFEEDVRGSYILNSKDLNLMPKLDEYLSLGVDSFKIEGRNKSAYYVAIAARAYRMAIDDWYKDPENWSAEKYLTELDSLSNRGYTIAFHEGRLKNLSHNYLNTKSTSEWEFAGIISEWQDDYMIIDVKNRLVSGEVLEFVPPAPLDTIFLRLYEFIDFNKNDQIKQVMNPGHNPKIKIPVSVFDQEDISSLKDRLPVFTVLRKEKPISAVEKSRIKYDKVANKIEDGQNAENLLNKARGDLVQNIEENNVKNPTTKTPRLGLDGCCGRGCNGCLLFWHDDKYAAARAKLKDQKIGVMLKEKAA
jgi:U32 family peptidase